MSKHYFTGFMVNEGGSPDDYMDGTQIDAGWEGSPHMSVSYAPFEYDNRAHSGFTPGPVPKVEFSGILLEGTDLGSPTRTVNVSPSIDGTIDVVGADSFNALRQLTIKARIEGATQQELQTTLGELERLATCKDVWDLGLKPHPNAANWTYFRIVRSSSFHAPLDHGSFANYRGDVDMVLMAEPFSHGGTTTVYDATKIVPVEPQGSYWPSEWQGGTTEDLIEDDGTWCFMQDGTTIPDCRVDWYNSLGQNIGNTDIFSGIIIRKKWRTIHQSFSPPAGASGARLYIGNISNTSLVPVDQTHRHYVSICIRKSTSRVRFHRVMFGDGIVDTPGTIALPAMSGTMQSELEVDVHAVEDVVSTIFMTAVDDSAPWHEELSATGDSALPDTDVNGARSQSGNCLHGEHLNPTDWNRAGNIHCSDYPHGDYRVIYRAHHGRFVESLDPETRDLRLRIAQWDAGDRAPTPTNYNQFQWPRHARWGWTWLDVGIFTVHAGARARIQAWLTKYHYLDTFIVMPEKYGVLSFNTDLYDAVDRRDRVTSSVGWDMKSERDWQYVSGAPHTKGHIVTPPGEARELLVVASTDRHSQQSHQTAPIAVTVRYRPRYSTWVTE